MRNINELTLAKELIKFPSITPRDAGAMKFLAKQYLVVAIVPSAESRFCCTGEA